MTGKYINPDTDGKFYDLESMVRADCHDCEGCYRCCQDMGDSIVLDPYDLYQMGLSLGVGWSQLLEKGYLAIGMHNGMVLPHIRMSEDKNQCPFLNEQNRCGIHDYRPGMCRLFPLGRNYEDGRMNYILLNRVCAKTDRTKIKVSKWIGVTAPAKYHNFVLAWHDFRKEMASRLSEADEQQARTFHMYILGAFYTVDEKDEESFYESFYKKIDRVKNAFGV